MSASGCRRTLPAGVGKKPLGKTSPVCDTKTNPLASFKPRGARPIPSGKPGLRADAPPPDAALPAQDAAGERSRAIAVETAGDGNSMRERTAESAVPLAARRSRARCCDIPAIVLRL